MERFRPETRIDGETHALSLLPRFNPAIQSIGMSVRRPDGGTEILLLARTFRWSGRPHLSLANQSSCPGVPYLRATAYFENTSDTPQPARRVLLHHPVELSFREAARGRLPGRGLLDS